MSVLTPNELTRQFWAMLEARGLPRNAEAIDIHLRSGDVIKITCTFAVKGEAGELRLIENEIERRTEDLVLVAAAELEALKASLAAHQEAGKQPGHYAEGGPVRPGLGLMGE